MSVFEPVLDVRNGSNDMSSRNVNEPIFDVAQLAHVELLTPDLEGTLRFLKDLLGMQETERTATSAYLRGYEEQYHHSLVVTAAPRAGLGHVAWRARSPQALERRVEAIEATGFGRGWIDGDVGHGRAYRFDTPEGHPMELLWDVDYVRALTGQQTPLRNRPSKRSQAGVPVRRIDHLNLMVANAGAVRDFLVDVLGFRERERVVADDDGSVVASFLSVTNLSHDIAIVPEPTEMRGRLHHVCFHYISVQHLFDVAELAKEAGIAIESGPARHGIGGGNVPLRAGAGGQSHRAHGRSRLHDLRSGLADRRLEGIRGSRYRRGLDRLAAA
jgi:catechol 2,3-dioxygenase